MSPTLDLYTKLSSLSLQDLIKWKLNYTSPIGPKTNELALFIIAVDAKRERNGSLRAFLQEKFGHIDANVYKPLRVWRMMVVDAEIAPAGWITPRQFQNVPVKWHITASAILGKLQETNPDHTEVRIELASVLTRQPADGWRRLQSLVKRVATTDQFPAL